MSEDDSAQLVESIQQLIDYAVDQAETGELPATVEEQAAQSLENIRAILEEAGFRKTDVLKTVVYLKNMSDFAAVNAVYAGFFGSHKPARSCVEAAQLPRGGLVEIELIAKRGPDGE